MAPKLGKAPMGASAAPTGATVVDVPTDTATTAEELDDEDHALWTIVDGCLNDPWVKSSITTAFVADGAHQLFNNEDWIKKMDQHGSCKGMAANIFFTKIKHLMCKSLRPTVDSCTTLGTSAFGEEHWKTSDGQFVAQIDWPKTIPIICRGKTTAGPEERLTSWCLASV